MSVTLNSDGTCNKLYIEMGKFGTGYFLPDPVSDFLEVPSSEANSLISSSEIQMQ